MKMCPARPTSRARTRRDARFGTTVRTRARARSNARWTTRARGEATDGGWRFVENWGFLGVV
jgi:hypothetical protein